MPTSPTNDRPDLGPLDIRRESTERRILESAVELIGTGVPWNQLGIRQIAERAQLSRTAFYDFFGSKNEVLEHLMTGLHDDLSTILIEPTSAGGGAFDPPHLRSVLDRVADFNDRHGPVYRAFLDATGEDPRLQDLWDDLTGIYAKVIGVAIGHARASQPAAPRSPDGLALARVLLVMTERTMLLMHRAPDADAGHSRSEMLEALALVWERAVFGRSLPA